MDKHSDKVVQGKVAQENIEDVDIHNAAQVAPSIDTEIHSEIKSEIKAEEQLTLHEERARIEVVRQQIGGVTLHKVVQERVENIPVTLTREVLQITIHEGTEVGHIQGLVLADGQELIAGQTYEIPLSEERASIIKEVFPISRVEVSKQVVQAQHTEEIILRREELEVNDPNGLIAQDIIK